MHANLTTVVPALIFWTAGLLRLPAARRNRGPRLLCLALLSFGVTLTLDVAPVYRSLDRALAVANLAELLEHLFTLLGATLLLVMLRGLLAGEPGARQPRWLLPLGVATMLATTALFLAAPVGVDTVDFTNRYGGLPEIVAYWAVDLLFAGACLIELGRLFLRYGQRSQLWPIRVGFRVAATGVALGILYSLDKIVALVGRQVPAGGVVHVAEQLNPILLAAGTIVLGAGLALPPVANVLSPPVEAASAWWSLQVLRPLWRDLCRAAPHVVLADAPSLGQDVFQLQALPLRRYRRLIEIRDAALTLRPRVDVRVLDAARARAVGLVGQRRDAVVEACWLRAALRAHAEGHGLPAVQSDADEPLVDRQDEAAELHFLRQVAWAWRLSPRVRKFETSLAASSDRREAA